MRFKKNVTYTKHCDWPVTNSLNKVRTLTRLVKSHTQTAMTILKIISKNLAHQNGGTWVFG